MVFPLLKRYTLVSFLNYHLSGLSTIGRNGSYARASYMSFAASAPWRRIVTSPPCTATMVDASLHGVSPASTATSTPLKMRGSTSTNEVGAGLPCVLADVMASGESQRRISSCTTDDADARNATVPSDARMKAGTRGPAGTTRVRLIFVLQHRSQTILAAHRTH